MAKSKKKNKTKKAKKKKNSVKRTYRDSIFRALFNDEKTLRELYSVLSGQPVTNKATVEIVTLKDAIHNNRKNDLAFTVDSKMIVLIEQQSTDSPNLPIRMFIYLAKLYDKMLDERVYRTTKIKIPMPELYVFYNGKANREEEWEQKLSDLFATVRETLSVEVIVKVININYEKGAELVKQCKTLNGYSLLLYKVQYYLEQGMSLEDAMKLAIQECIEEDVIADFLKKNGGKTMSILRQVWTEEQKEKMHRIELEEAVDEAVDETKKSDALGMKLEGISLDIIKRITGLSYEVLEAL